MDNSNLIKADRILVGEVGEITLLQHKPEQRWYYLAGQKTSEPYIFCTWDSNDPKFPDVARREFRRLIG